MNNEINITRRQFLNSSGALLGLSPSLNLINNSLLDSDKVKISYLNQEIESIKKLPDFQAGFSYLEYGFEGQDTNLDIYKKETGLILDRLVENNANSVSYVFPLFQDGWTGNSVYSDKISTPSLKTISTFIDESHKRNLSVMLRPIIDETAIKNDPIQTTIEKWRGTIQPNNPVDWFGTYGNELLKLATLSKAKDVESICIGAELNSMEQYTFEWKNLIDSIREKYDGELVYAMNWGVHYYGVSNPDFLKLVDRVGIDAFYPHDLPSGSSKNDLINSWQSFGLLEIRAIRELTGKNPFLAEIGVRSQDASWKAPFLWKDETASVNQDDQKVFYEATCEAVIPEVSGWYPWAVGRNSLSVDPETDFTFDPTNKKAELVIRECNENVIFDSKTM